MLLAGPVCSFKDYMDFIEGRNIARAIEKVSEIYASKNIKKENNTKF